jgi:hypothetical protein
LKEKVEKYELIYDINDNDKLQNELKKNITNMKEVNSIKNT